MKNHLFFILFVFCFSPAFSQDLDNFMNLKCSGPMPEYFVKTLSDKIDSDNRELASSRNLSRQESKNFSAITNYTIQRLIKSGKLLYGDPLTNYANRVLDKLKAASDVDLSHIQIYTFKSKEVNAFATHQGVIYLTVGLWGQIENEAQLANVIAHEITHVIKKHSLNTFVFTNDMLKNSRYGSSLQLSKFYKYSKDNENEADKEGLKLALKAGYSPDALLSTMDVLLYSYLPIDLIPVDYSWIENAYLKIPDDYKLEEINPISSEEKVDDEESTHPNIVKRKLLAEKIIDNYSQGDGSLYLAGTEEEFKKLQDLARFAMLNMFIVNQQYIDGMYHIRILSQKYPNNSFLKATEGMMWYGLVKLGKNGENSIKSSHYKKVEGDIQQLYFLFKKLTRQELTVLATRQIWHYSLENPDNKILADLRTEILTEFLKYRENDINNFASEFTIVSEQIEEEEKDEKKSKYDKINKKNKKKAKSNFLFNAMVELKKNDMFLASYDEYKEKIKNEIEIEDDDEEEVIDTYNHKQVSWKSGSIKKDDSFRAISSDSLLMLTPTGFRFKKKSSPYKNLIALESDQKSLLELYKNTSANFNVHLFTLNDFETPNYSTDDYNNFSVFYDFLGEKYSNDNSNTMYAFHGAFLNEIISMYNTKYILISSFHSYQYFGEIRKKNIQEYLFVIYDLEKQNVTYFQQDFYNIKFNKYNRNAHIYKFLNEIIEK